MLLLKSFTLSFLSSFAMVRLLEIVTSLVHVVKMAVVMSLRENAAYARNFVMP